MPERLPDEGAAPSGAASSYKGAGNRRPLQRKEDDGMSTDFKETLNLPSTDFPMRASLARREPEFLAFWSESNVYEKLMESRKDADIFILHDGPPYANGNIHIGTAFNKILKDFIPKYKWLRGFRAPYIPGWDTHGLPIELRVLREEGISKDDINPVSLRKSCKEYAERYIDVQRDEFKRLGVLGDWEHPYLTFNSAYEAAQIGAFADMVEKGYVYKGRKPVFWCVDCQTALAAAEIEYEDETSPSIYVAYPVKPDGPLAGLARGRDIYVVIWTTTPWTLPASLAVALHPEVEYGLYEHDGSVYIVAKALAGEVSSNTVLCLKDPESVFSGKELEGQTAVHPFYDSRMVPFVNADYVGLDQGTGCVHTAPGHGVEDYETGARYGLEILNPVDDRGCFLDDTPMVGGLSLEKGSEKVLEILTESGRLLGQGSISHSYPHCWRCKKPVIFRATEQWFVSVNAFRDTALDQIDSVQWVPEWGRERIANMVRDRSDWCISRQRVWGVPIPAFYCEECGHLVLTADRVREVQKHIARRGSNYWWEASPSELLGSLAICPDCGSKKLRKETDIMDVWFDSGCSHRAVLETREELRWPADMYLEGSDQHRGWFQTSLLTSVATRERAPYDIVLTHGFIVDGDGRKMSKSMGNVIAPQEIIDRYGADILRLWVASTDYRNDIRISDQILSNLVESYRRIRNTARFLLGNLYDFDPVNHMVQPQDMEEMDRWILNRLEHLKSKTTKGYDEYEFHLPTYMIHQFCANDLSALYLDINKDRLYAELPSGHPRRSCQSAMWILLETLVPMLSPVLSFTAEEIWQSMRKINGGLPESVFLADWPAVYPERIDKDLEKKWENILMVRGAVSRALENARSQNLIKKSLEAAVSAWPGDGTEISLDILSKDEWAAVSIVSYFDTVEPETQAGVRIFDEETGMWVQIVRAIGGKCPRCWKLAPEVDEKGVCSRCSDVLNSI